MDRLKIEADIEVDIEAENHPGEKCAPRGL